MRDPHYLVGIGCMTLVSVVAVPVVVTFRNVPPGSAPQHVMVFLSAWIAATLWYVGAWLLLANRNASSPGAGRLWWTTGCVFALLHVAVAMHAAHGWSHRAAYRHTEEVGGFGWGVYVNYAFVVVWLADVLWQWVFPAAYMQRSRFVGLAVHGFLAFIVFNATIVFARGAASRTVALAGFAAMAWEAVRTRRSERGGTAA